MKRGLILVNAYSDMPSQNYQADRLKEEFEKQGITIDIRKNNYFECSIMDSKIERLGEYDFCVYLDKDKYISDMLERSGMRLFNSHQAILDCDDKMCTYIRLAGKDIRVVDTMSGLLCYTDEANIEDVTVNRIEEKFGYPVIVKECFGSLGKGVYKCDNRAELTKIMQDVKVRPHLFQRCVKTSIGKDIRVIVIGGECVAAMLRSSDGDFRSNLALGGHGEVFPLDDNIRELAMKITRALNLDYAGIDLLFGDADMTTDNLIVCEVNSNAFFGGIESVTHVNVAKAYADYIIGQVYVDRSVLVEHANRIGITSLAVTRCDKKLMTFMDADDLVDICRGIVLDESSNIYKSGKNWYVDDGNIRFTINGSTYMIITADSIN